jgi:hypothetical protein
MKALATAVLLLAAACQITPHDDSNFVIAYNLTAAAGVTCDSVKYENTTDILKVAGPTLPWSYAFQGPAGARVEVRAWMTGTASGQAAKLKATWTRVGMSTAGDSSFGSTTAPGKVLLLVSRRAQ